MPNRAPIDCKTQVAPLNILTPDVIDFKDTQPPILKEISDEEKEQDFQRKHQEYVADRLNRREEEIRRRKQKYGTSSSDEDEEFEEPTNEKKRSQFIQDQPYLGQQNQMDKSNDSDESLPVYRSKNKNLSEWMTEDLKLEECSFVISERIHYFSNFEKVKVISGDGVKDCQRLKITPLRGQEFMFAISMTRKQAGLPLHYYIFAYIIQQKLKEMRYKLSKVVQVQIPGISEAISKNSKIYGKIWKKSQHFGDWQQRLVVINHEGIFSYRSINQKASMFIKAKGIRELWTRFQVRENFLVVKIMYDLKKKTEFGIPMTPYLEEGCWLYHFYSLVFLNRA